MLEDAIKQLQELFKSFSMLYSIEIGKDSFKIVLLDEKQKDKELVTTITFATNETVEALRWLEEKHGIDPDS